MREVALGFCFPAGKGEGEPCDHPARALLRPGVALLLHSCVGDTSESLQTSFYNRFCDPSSLPPVRAHSTDTTVATEAASTRVHCRRGRSLAGGTRGHSEGGTEETALPGHHFLKDLEGPHSPLSSEKLQFLLCI